MPGSGTVMPTTIPSTYSHTDTGAAPSLEALVGEYYAYIRRLALTILDDGQGDASAEAEDAAQETFITAHRSLAGFRGRASLKTWLTAIAVNACRGRLRKRRLRQTLQATLQGLHLARQPESPEETAVENEARRQLWQAVDGLDEKHRLPVILRYVHELSVAEIAASLGASEGTIHSRLHYARKALLDRLEAGDEEASDESFV